MLQGRNNEQIVFAAGHSLLAHSPSSEHLLQPISGPTISRQHKVSNMLQYTSPQGPPPAGNGGACQEKGGSTSLHQFVQWVCNLQNKVCPNVLQLHGKVIFQGTGLQRHQAATVAARVTAACERLASLQGEALHHKQAPLFLTARMETGSCLSCF